MVRKIKAKAILRLNDQGLSGRAIARSLGIARQSVAEVLAASAAAGIAYPDVETKPDDEVYSMPFPGRGERESALRAARLGQGPPRARACRSDPAHPARRVRRRMRRRGQASHGLRPFLQAVRRLCGEDRCDEQGRAQGRTHHRGRLGRQDHADRRSGHRRRFEGVPVRSGAAVQPVRVRGADARHGAERLAAVPRCDVRVVRRLHATSGVRQPQDRRDQPSARRRGRAQRRVPLHGRALFRRGDPRTRAQAEGQAVSGEHGMARDHGAGGSDARPRVRVAGRAARGRPRVAGRVQFPSVPETRRLQTVRVRVRREAAADTAAGNGVRGGGLDIRQEGAVQLPRRVCAQLVFRPVRLRRNRRGPARRLRHARGVAQGLQALHAQAPARHGGQPIQRERDRPAREGRMEAMGPGTLRAMGETRRTGLRGRRREAVRRAALRRPGGGARVGGAAALETLFRAASRERVLAGPAVGRLAKVLAHQADTRDRPGHDRRADGNIR